MLPNELRSQIIAIVGPERSLDSDNDRFTYSYDGSFVPLVPAHLPDLTVFPLNVDEVAKVVRLCNEHGVPLVPRGAGSGRTGGSIPVKGGVVLSLERMNRILEIDRKNMIALVEPGVRTIDLCKAVEAVGLFYPPDPSSWTVSTMGGNIAENAGGARAVKYGVTKDYVMGLEVVLADGTVITTGGKAVKNVTGYDLTHLFVGSEGTLGVVTKILVRLVSKPEAKKTLLLMFATVDDASECVSDMLSSGIVPASAEIMDKTSIQAVARFRKVDIPAEAEAALLIDIDGPQKLLDDQAVAVAETGRRHHAVQIREAGTAAEADELWVLRRTMGPAVAAIAKNKIGEDISVPRAALPEMIRRLGEIGKKHGLTIAVFGHAGDGNLHPSILTDLSRPGARERVDEAVAEVFRAALDVGGTLSGEHGIGITKKPFIEEALGKGGVEALRAVKRALDPKGILNPGKIFE